MSHPTSDTVPPKPARSAFMCFSGAKQKETSELLGTTRKNDIIKHVAEAWRSLSNKERAVWDEEARKDKLRFVREKATYTGPWTIPKKRAKKHPGAPKRPMSAFLKFSQTRRSIVKQENPDMENTDVSRLLGEMWRNEHPSKRAPYVEQEKRERAVYKNMSAEWRVKQSRLDATSRTTQHQIHQKMVEHPQQAFDRNHRDGGGKYVENDRNQQNIENLHGAHNCRNHTPNMDYLASSDRHPPAPATEFAPYHPTERGMEPYQHSSSYEPFSFSRAFPQPQGEEYNTGTYQTESRASHHSDRMGYSYSRYL